MDYSYLKIINYLFNRHINEKLLLCHITREDFYFIVCGHENLYKEKLEGDNKILYRGKHK